MSTAVTAIPTHSAAESAAEKLANGSLMTLEEVAAQLSVSSDTVHRLPLKSIRLGRLLRFDPKDVSQLIADSKEAVVACGGSNAAEGRAK